MSSMVGLQARVELDPDQHVVLRGMSWQDFEALLALRGDRAGARATGLDKQEIYRRLGVRELWTLKSDGTLVVRMLENDAWVEAAKTKLLPKLDLAWLVTFLDITPQSKAVRALRDALRTKKRRS